MTPDDVVQEMIRQHATVSRLATVLQGPIKPGAVTAGVTAPLEVTWRRDTSGTYVIVLNLSTTPRSAQAITLKGTGAATTAVVYDEGRNIPIVDGKIVDDFDSFALHIYQIH